MISKSLSSSRKFAALNHEPLGEFCQVLYMLLIAHSDDFGRLEGDLFTVKHLVIPSSKRDETQIQQALTALDAVKLIAWYEVDGSRYVQIIDFERHQSGLHKRTSSRFPRVPGKSRKFSGVPSELKGTEQNGTEENGRVRSAEPKIPQKAAGRSYGVFGGSLPREHLDHAACDDSLSRCVPNAVHGKLANGLAPRHGGDRDAAKAALLAWYPAVWSSLPPDFVMGDAFKFWQSRFDAAFATPETPGRRAGQESIAPRHCRHEPRCLDDAEHTRKVSAERKQVAS